MLAGKRILYGVLNWGLGHASRSVQLIRQLEELKAEVVIASDGDALHFLKTEFPNRNFIELPELKIHYASVFGLQWSIISQIPRLMQALKAEKVALDQHLKSNSIDLIISDNRYGVYHNSIPSILLSHQLNLQLKVAKRKADSFMRKLISNFNEVWVPDEDGALLSAELSKLNKLTIKKTYIGSLSHLSILEKSDFQSKTIAKYLAILSGPEPLRSHLEKLLVVMANRQKVPLQIIRGRREKAIDYKLNGYVEFANQMSSREIIEAAQNHLGLICRSGYSSIMDLSRMGIPALMIPTPGQTEQEHLASYHMSARHFYAKKEKQLDLKRDIEYAFNGDYKPPTLNIDLKKQREIIIERLEDLLS